MQPEDKDKAKESEVKKKSGLTWLIGGLLIR